MVTRAKYDVLENVIDTWRGRCLFSCNLASLSSTT